jgi:uncharacterized iron-regulated membrane protein
MDLRREGYSALNRWLKLVKVGLVASFFFIVMALLGLPESVFIVTSPFVAHNTLPSQFLAMA